jgi:hypothetical protein
MHPAPFVAERGGRVVPGLAADGDRVGDGRDPPGRALRHGRGEVLGAAVQVGVVAEVLDEMVTDPLGQPQSQRLLGVDGFALA